MNDLDYVIVGFDGATKEIYENIRQGADFNKVKKMLGILSAQKFPITCLQFIVMRENEHEREMITRLGRDIGVDIVVLKGVHVSSHEARGLIPNEERYRIEIYRENFQRGKRSPRKRRCSRPWSMMVVNWDGSVNPCCKYYDCLNYNMGNVFVDGFENIWFSERFSRFRKKLIRDMRSIPMCVDCYSNVDLYL